MIAVKDKAKELIDRFTFNCIECDYTENAIQSAIMAVDEIINSSPSLPILGQGGYFYEDIKLSKKYWQEVKREIEKL